MEWQRARRILAVRLDTMGDVLMTTPALRALAEGRRLTLLTSEPGAQIAGYLPEVDDVLLYDPPWMKATAARGADEDLAMIRRLREGRYDGAVIFTVYSQSPLPAALLCFLAGIPLRLAHCRENPYQLLTDWVPESEPEEGVRHEVRRQLDLMARIGVGADDERIRLAVPIRAGEEALSILEQEGIDLSAPWIVLHAGASAPSRRYPEEGYALAASRLVREDGLQVVLTGNVSESSVAARVAETMREPSISLAGRLSLAQFIGLLSSARLLLSNNTGPVHLAAALGLPVVDLYALTNPQHTPWMVPNRVLSHDVPCRWCYKSICPMGHHLCLRGVSPDEIVTSVRQLLVETNRPAPTG